MQYIVSTVTENPFWDAWAESIELKTHTGFFSFKIEDYPGGIYCGIARNGISSSVSEIKYGFYIESNKFAAVESGSLKTNLTPFSIGSVFKISVKDSSIVLSVDDVEAFSFAVNWFATNQSYRLYFGGYSFGDAVVDAAHGFEQTEANVSSLSYAPASVISCDNQNPLSIYSETTEPICTSRACSTALINTKSYQPSCNIVTGNEQVASISSSVPFPTARLTSIRIPFVSYVNTLTYPIFSRTYATTPARVSTSAIPAESIIFSGEGEDDFTAIISGKTTLPASSAITNDSAWVYSSAIAPESQILASDIVDDLDAIISGSVYFSATLISEGADTSVVDAICPAWSAIVVSSDTSDDIDAAINSYTEIAAASVLAGESSWVRTECPMAMAEALAVGIDGSSMAMINGESSQPVSTIECSESAWIMASSASVLGILETGSIDDVWLASVSSQTGGAAGELLGGTSQWVSALTAAPVSRLGCGAINDELSTISSHTVLAVSSITAETSTSILSATAQPEGLVISEGKPNCPAIIVAELPQIFSFSRTQNDSFFYSTITLPLLRMEFLGLGLISGKILEIDSSRSKIVASTLRGAKIGTEDKGMVHDFAISIRESSAIYAGSTIIEKKVISISGEISSLASVAYIKANGILDVSGSVFGGSSMKLSKPLHVYGELRSSSDVHASIEMREEEEALAISGNMHGPKYELAYIYADELLSINGSISSEIISASIIATLTIISEESILIEASKTSATIDIALAMETIIDGYLSSLGVSTTLTTSSRAQKLIAISGKVLASTARSQR